MSAHQGPFGSAVKLDCNPTLNGYATTITWWLLTGNWHPLWPQFVISVVHLRPVGGVSDARLQFPGATHELMIVALDPGNPPAIHPAEGLEAEGLAYCGFLQPIDVIHQFTATDEEMAELVDLCARACVHGILTPSTDDARDRLREAWLAACVKTLAHMRGEAHAT